MMERNVLKNRVREISERLKQQYIATGCMFEQYDISHFDGMNKVLRLEYRSRFALNHMMRRYDDIVQMAREVFDDPELTLHLTESEVR